MQSYSTDDIPATADHILTYTGAHVVGRANHNVSYVQISANEQKVWFFTDNASLDHEHIYYNRRYRASASAPWYWQFSVSPAVTSYGAAPGAVLYSPSPKYVDTRTSTSYSYIMYQIVQPCSDALGYLRVVFSSDGICWTSPQVATHLGGSMSYCLGMSNTVPAEEVTAFDDGMSSVKLMYMEGDISYLANSDHMDETAVVGASVYGDPSNILIDGTGKMSNVGVFSPSLLRPTWGNSYENRFEPYHYFMNLQAAFDAATGDMYVGRAYPNSYDRGPKDPYDNQDIWVPMYWQVIPVMMYDSNTGRTVQVGGCVQWPATLPNRIQLYKMHIGSLSNFAMVGYSSSQWTFLEDLGNGTGYTDKITGSYTPLVYNQTNAGRDYASVSFIRDGQGNLIRFEDGSAKFFAGDTFELSKSNGPCQVTGLERETVLAVP